MEEEMEELYAEGLATHGGPESCVDDPRGRGEALAGARAGRAIEPRNLNDRGADAVQEVEGNIAGGARREPLTGPARSENQGMCGTSMRENRESPCLPVRLVSGRAAQGTPVAVSLR
jgi:RNA-directed DNA polymerase